MMEDYQAKNQMKPLAGSQHRIRRSSPTSPPPTYRSGIEYHTNGDHQISSRVNRSKIFISELLGTLVLVYLGQSTLSSFELIGTQSDIINRQLATVVTAGLAFLAATLISLNLSGAHLNPAFTLASAVYKRTRWSLVATYLTAQYLGSLLAAIFLHVTYCDKLAQRHLEGSLLGLNSTLKAHGNILSTGKLFTSFPPTEVSLMQLFVGYTLANVVFSMILVSIHSSKLLKIPRYMKPIYLSLALILVQAAFSANGGLVLNPAQDFAPRLYISLFGWGSSAFNLYSYDYWYTCGIFAPHFGALIGFGLYRILNYANNLDDATQAHHHPHHQVRQTTTTSTNVYDNPR